MDYTRRNMLVNLGRAGLGTAMLSAVTSAGASSLLGSLEIGSDQAAGKCQFKLAVINDEISQDFEKACKIASQDFGLSWIELRGMWDKNITALSDKEIKDAENILAEHKLQVTDIASPLFKTDWPGA